MIKIKILVKSRAIENVHCLQHTAYSLAETLTSVPLKTGQVFFGTITTERPIRCKKEHINQRDFIWRWMNLESTNPPDGQMIQPRIIWIQLEAWDYWHEQLLEMFSHLKRYESLQTAGRLNQQFDQLWSAGWGNYKLSQKY